MAFFFSFFFFFSLKKKKKRRNICLYPCYMFAMVERRWKITATDSVLVDRVIIPEQTATLGVLQDFGLVGRICSAIERRTSGRLGWERGFSSLSRIEIWQTRVCSLAGHEKRTRLVNNVWSPAVKGRGSRPTPYQKRKTTIKGKKFADQIRFAGFLDLLLFFLCLLLL